MLTRSASGENFELRAELNSEYRDRRADAIKRVIANMTVGKDVSGLFPDVLKNMVRAFSALGSTFRSLSAGSKPTTSSKRSSCTCIS